MPASFDLVHEPWIPVVQSGRTTEVGLLEALLRAHDIVEVRDPMPTVEFGLHRLLVALVLDIFQWRHVGDLEATLAAGAFDSPRVQAYFERWKDRFDLFHEMFPFMQTATWQGDETSDTKPVARLVQALPSGTNVAHFRHELEDTVALCAPCAARMLTTVAPFMTAGGAGLSPSINGAAPIYLHLIGNSLFESLCFNSYVGPLPQAVESVPCWRSAHVPGAERTETGLLESLTWQPRRIKLLCTEGGLCTLSGATSRYLVRRMLFKAGDKARIDGWVDPNVAYRMSSEERHPLRPSEDKALWRDIGPLLLLKEGDVESTRTRFRFARPRLVDQYADLRNRGVLARCSEFRTALYWLRTDLKMKIFEWDSEALSLPWATISQPVHGERLQGSIEVAERVGYLLKSSLRVAHPRDGAGNSHGFASLIAEAQRRYWSSLRLHFDRLVYRLAELNPEQDIPAIRSTEDQWLDGVSLTARTSFESAVQHLDSNGQAIRRVVAARQQCQRELTRALRNARDVGGTCNESPKVKTTGSRQDAGSHAERSHLAAETRFFGKLAALGHRQLAVLKHNAGNTLADARNCAWFYRLLDAEQPIPPDMEFLAATLYSCNVRSTTGSFGLSMRRLAEAVKAESIERRFLVLLDAEFQRDPSGPAAGVEAAVRLRQLVRLAASKAVGIDWPQLLHDVKAWSAPNRVVQKRWANDFFLPSPRIRPPREQEVVPRVG